jgi:hypothetical protein
MQKWLFIGVLGCLIVSCNNVNNQNPVPYVPVNYTLRITSEYPHFVVDNGYQTMTVTSTKLEREYLGYAGLLIWVGMDGNYHAADLCCPNCLIKNKPVQVDGLFAICPTCEEKYDLSYGYAFPTTGKTQFPLRYYISLYQYDPAVAGYTLRIRN